MKVVLFCFLISCLGVTLSGQTEEPPLDYSSAVTIAEEQDKVVMMIFAGSDWCKPCIRLREEVLTSEDFISYAGKHLVLLELDFPYRKKNQLSKERTSHNARLADRFNKEGIFPRIVLLDAQEQLVGQIQNTQNLDPKAFIRLINTLLES